MGRPFSITSSMKSGSMSSQGVVMMRASGWVSAISTRLFSTLAGSSSWVRLKMMVEALLT